MTLVIAAAAVILSPLVAYLATAKRLSGKVQTSEASDLWEESRSIRQDYQRRIEELNRTLRECNERIDGLEERNQRLYLENGNLKRMIEEHEETIREMRAMIHSLSGENKMLKADNIVLRARVSELEASNGNN